jgi:hypothetical protein
MKTKKLRWYCAACNVACSNPASHTTHMESSKHAELSRKSSQVRRADAQLSEVDISFKDKFLGHLIAKHFGQRVLAHELYARVFLGDIAHSQVKATRWKTLGTFVFWLSRNEPYFEAAKTPEGWLVSVANEDALVSPDAPTVLSTPLPPPKRRNLSNHKTTAPQSDVSVSTLKGKDKEESNDTRAPVRFSLVSQKSFS